MKQSDSYKRDFSDVPVRIRSWLIIIAILTVSLMAPEITYLSVTFLTWGCSREYAHITRQNDIIAQCLPGVLIAFLMYCSFTDMYVWFAVITFFMALVAALILRRFSLFKMLLIAPFSVGTLAFIRNINIQTEPKAGIKVVLFLLILTELNDIFQYLCGKFFGHRQIAPRISPNKTVEGFVGGVILTTALGGLLGPLLLPKNAILIYFLLGCVISVAGFAGDLFMSAEKRRLNIKDTGHLIPGHGGLLDRVDSLLFITPLFYWTILWINTMDIR